MTPNDLGKNFTVEDCERLPVYSFFKDFRTNLKKAALSSTLEVSQTKVSLAATPTRFGGFRLWFLCPHCERKIKVLLIHPFTGKVGCRGCLGLTYRKQRYKGMVEGNFV